MNIEDLTKKILAFRNERDWQQFHKPKDLAISISLEAAEVLEHFQWKTDEEITEYLKTHKEDLADELADVMNYLMILAHTADINLAEAVEKKIIKAGKKYPVDKAKGSAKKYNQL